jgi:long-chain acyl-CoA synthetase
MNIAQNIERAAAHFPDQPAILFEGQRISYRELLTQVDRAARGLASLGVGPGDRVALFLPNIPAFPIAYLATVKLGAIAVSVNSMLTTGELRYVLEDAGVNALFTTEALMPAVTPLLGQVLPAYRVIICEGSAAGCLTLAELGDGHDGPFPTRDMDRDAPAAILYTSGTTGRQKGATLSHGNVVSNMYSTGHAMRIDPADRAILFLPLFHCFGQNFIMNAAFNSAATVVLHRRFVPDAVLDSIARDGVTIFCAVPTIYIGLLNAGVPRERLAGVRIYFSAAATMPVEIASRWREIYGKPVYEGYGLTETSPFACYNHEWEHRQGSVGTPIEMVEMRVLDPEDREVPRGQWGEIAIKGPNVMLGYWNRPEASAEALRGGWFHTGDIGYMDEAGYIYLVDRVKDMINAAGFKIWPREVEEVLYQHEAVKECAVAGVADPLKGECARAWIVLRPGATWSEDAVLSYCRERLAAYKVPESVVFADELPKSSTGKILKRVLRDQAR